MSGASVLVWPHAETDSLAETVHALISHSGGRVNAEYSPRNRSSFCNQNVQWFIYDSHALFLQTNRVARWPWPRAERLKPPWSSVINAVCLTALLEISHYYSVLLFNKNITFISSALSAIHTHTHIYILSLSLCNPLITEPLRITAHGVSSPGRDLRSTEVWRFTASRGLVAIKSKTMQLNSSFLC